MEQLEILNKIQGNKFERKVFMPNEIFAELKENIDGSSQIGFAYSYLYLVTYMYRYARYGSCTIDTKEIKKALGYSPVNKKIDSIIKKNGLLEEMKLVKTETDFPISYTFTNEDQDLDFDMFSGQKDNDGYDYIRAQVPRNYKVKMPLRGFYRHINTEDHDDAYHNGTFFEIENTHEIGYDVFFECMTNVEIGCVGFYLYSYLKSKYQIHQNGYDVSIDKIEFDTGIKKRTVNKYLDALKKYNLVSCKINQPFVIGLSNDKCLANTYYANDVNRFCTVAQTYTKRKVISLDTWQKKEKDKKDFINKLDKEMEDW